MRRQSIAIAGMIILTLALAIAAMAADPFVGTWKLNVAKSKVPDPKFMPKSEMLKAESLENGLRCSYDGIEADGKSYTVMFSAKYDGRSYPVKSSIINPATGSSFIDTKTLKRIDATILEYVDKKAGKEVERGRIAVSKDGKTLTDTVKGIFQGQEFTATWIYEKQHRIVYTLAKLKVTSRSPNRFRVSSEENQ